MILSRKDTHSLLSIDDFALFTVLLFSVLVMFFLWLITNTIGVLTLGGWNFVFILSLLFASTVIFLTYKKQGISQNIHFSLTWLNLLFITLIAISFFYIVYPAMKYPFTSIGIPNKDVHDGISAYIADYGATPSHIFPEATAFIMNSHEGLYLDYPNVMHVISGFLISQHITIFSATWITYAILLSLASCGILLIFHLMDKNDVLSTVLAGLFPISSFRIWYAGIASIPMAFSFALLIIVLAIWIFLIKHRDFSHRYLLFGISGALLAASYSGTILVLFGFVILLITLCVIMHKKLDYFHFRKDLLYSIPIIILGFILQGKIYWQNTFPTSVDFDPFELSQRLMPIDDSRYMSLFLVFFIFSLLQLIKGWVHKENQKINLLSLVFMIIGMSFFSFIIYDFIFHIQLGSFSPEDLIKSSTGGIWSGLNHQKISRLALLQPFFWIFCIHVRISNQFWRRGVATLIGAFIIFYALTTLSPFPYNPIQPELYESFYNRTESLSLYDWLSTGRMRLVYNPFIWDSSIKRELDVIKRYSDSIEKVYLIDGRGWTEETVADWAAIYLRKSVIRVSQNSIEATYDKEEVLWVHDVTSEQYRTYLNFCRTFNYKDKSSFICRP